MYSPQTAYQSTEIIKPLQQKKLRDLLIYLNAKSPFYKELFSAHHINIAGINTLEDLTRIPTTDKENLQLRNDDFFCVPRNKIIEYSSTSGTLGSPVTVALT